MTQAQEDKATALELRREQRGKEVEIGNRGILLRNMADLMDFARQAVNSGVAPKGMNEGQAALAIQAGLERGMGPLGGLQAAVVINGVLSWRGWAAIAHIQNSGLVVPGTFRSYVEGSVEDGTARGICVAQRKGYDRPFTRTFSVADAKKAGLWKKPGPWQERPTNMLEWRAVGDMARFHFPEALGGVPIAEDVQAGGVGHVEVEAGPGEAPRPRATLGPGPALNDPLLGNVGAPVPQEDEPPMIEGAVIDVPVEQVRGSSAAEHRTHNPDEAGSTPAPATNHRACPRCNADEWEAGGLFDKCGVCNYPGPEPGEEVT